MKQYIFWITLLLAITACSTTRKTKSVTETKSVTRSDSLATATRSTKVDSVATTKATSTRVQTAAATETDTWKITFRPDSSGSRPQPVIITADDYDYPGHVYTTNTDSMDLVPVIMPLGRLPTIKLPAGAIESIERSRTKSVYKTDSEAESRTDSAAVNRSDTSSNSTAKTSSTQNSIKSKDKQVTRSGLPWWVWVVGGLILAVFAWQKWFRPSAVISQSVAGIGRLRNIHYDPPPPPQSPQTKP